MTSSSGRLLQLIEADIARVDETRRWPASRVLVASRRRAEFTDYVLALPDAALEGEALTSFLDDVAPFGCPIPGSLIRAYRLPDSLHPSILLREHEAAPDGVGEAYGRFLAHARRDWLEALEKAGPGLCPVLAWRIAPAKRFLGPDECTDAVAEAGIALGGIADQYLGRGLLLMTEPELASAWPTMMSLGGVTKARKMTGREFPVWVDLPAHQPALLASRVLHRVEALLADGRSAAS